jgi:hypothetical protein
LQAKGSDPTLPSKQTINYGKKMERATVSALRKLEGVAVLLRALMRAGVRPPSQRNFFQQEKKENGAGDGGRTHDLLLGKQAF